MHRRPSGTPRPRRRQSRRGASLPANPDEHLTRCGGRGCGLPAVADWHPPSAPKSKRGLSSILLLDFSHPPASTWFPDFSPLRRPRGCKKERYNFLSSCGYLPCIFVTAVRAFACMANPLSPALARTDYILGKLRGARMLDAMREVAATSRGSRTLANQSLRYPDAVARADEFLGDHGMALGKHLGSGIESLVWEVTPRDSTNRHVLKIRPQGRVEDFLLPEGVDGVSPYWAMSQAGPEIAMALQPRAAAVFRPAPGFERAFTEGAGKLRDSLWSRGWHWQDGHLENVGVTPEGHWTAIDGDVRPIGGSGSSMLPGWMQRPSRSVATEEAIRMLRLTPEEEAVIFGGR